MKPLDRFLMIENARPADEADGDATHGTAMSDRFAAMAAEDAATAIVTASAAPAQLPAAPAARDPFAPPPELDVAYELEPRTARSTLRCAECAFENARSAHDVCARCGTPLDSQASRHLNLTLEQDEHAAAFAARQAAAQQAAAAAADATANAGAIAAQPVVIDSAVPSFDRMVLRVTPSLARWPMPARRAVVVAAIGIVLGGGYALTHSPLIGFVLALAVTIGLCLVPT